MKKIISIIFSALLIFNNIKIIKGNENLDLYAKAAVLIDAENYRVLYGKNENEVMAMASTTKIMTLIIALEYCGMEEQVVFSPYACTAPDVQLNANKGETYYLKDLLYIMMLKSYNDVALAVAEHIGEIINDNHYDSEKTIEQSKSDINSFVNKMNEKAREYGLTNTYFITPNGLDARDENGFHSTTAYELAVIAAHAIKNNTIIEICTTREYKYSELNNKRQGIIYNANRFLDMQKGAIGLKTGFTNEAGYCFVGAVDMDDRKMISVVLGSGWPPNKNYKWKDTSKLINYGLGKYKKEIIFDAFERYEDYENYETFIPFEIKCLLTEDDEVEIIYDMYQITELKKDNVQVGQAVVYINNKRTYIIPVLAKKKIKKEGYCKIFFCIVKQFLF